MSENLLEARNLEAAYGPVKVLHGIDLALPRGSITTLLGANGAGKTSTLRALCQMNRTWGEITFDGAPIQQMSTEAIARLGIAHVPDGRGTFKDMTVEENLQLGAITRNDRVGIAADIDQMFQTFARLGERRHQLAGTLSGGEQQMLAISRALMLRPQLMLLDEPSFGLAPQVVNELFALIRRINTDRGTTILLVEQNAALTLEFADHAYLMETGRIVLSGPAETLKGDETIRSTYLGY